MNQPWHHFISCFPASNIAVNTLRVSFQLEAELSRPRLSVRAVLTKSDFPSSLLQVVLLHLFSVTRWDWQVHSISRALSSCCPIILASQYPSSSQMSQFTALSLVIRCYLSQEEVKCGYY